jgi:hypothetical protein
MANEKDRALGLGVEWRGEEESEKKGFHLITRKGKGEYAGKLGTSYSDWHENPRNVPTPLGDDRP